MRANFTSVSAMRSRGLIDVMAVVVLAGLFVAAGPAPGETASDRRDNGLAGGEVIDRVVAAVGNDPIFWTELEYQSGCLARVGRETGQGAVLRTLILQRLILREALRLRIVEPVDSEADLGPIVKSYIDTTIRPFVGSAIAPGGDPQGSGAWTWAEPDASLERAELVDTLHTTLAGLWARSKVRVLPGPWSDGVEMVSSDDVECLLLSSELAVNEERDALEAESGQE